MNKILKEIVEHLKGYGFIGGEALDGKEG